MYTGPATPLDAQHIPEPLGPARANGIGSTAISLGCELDPEPEIPLVAAFPISVPSADIIRPPRSPYNDAAPVTDAPNGMVVVPTTVKLPSTKAETTGPE